MGILDFSLGRTLHSREIVRNSTVLRYAVEPRIGNRQPDGVANPQLESSLFIGGHFNIRDESSIKHVV